MSLNRRQLRSRPPSAADGSCGAVGSGGQVLEQRWTRRALLGLAAAVPAAVKARAAEPAVRLSHVQGEKVSFFWGQRPLFEYRYSAARPKTYVHPLYAPNGVAVTLDSPPDHVHHRGIMLAWSDVKGFDFWGEENPAPHGRMVHRRFEAMREKPAALVTGVNHWIAEGEVLLIERQTIRALPPAAEHVWLEWESELKPAREALTLSAEKHPYNGLGIRFARSMDGGSVLNANGTATIEQANGEPAAWATYYGALEGGGLCGVAVFDHPRNPRHPTPFFVMNRFGYLSAAPTFREPFHLGVGQAIRLRYAVLAYLGAPARDRLEQLYRRWIGNER